MIVKKLLAILEGLKSWWGTIMILSDRNLSQQLRNSREDMEKGRVEPMEKVREELLSPS